MTHSRRAVEPPAESPCQNQVPAPISGDRPREPSVTAPETIDFGGSWPDGSGTCLPASRSGDADPSYQPGARV